MNRLRIVVAVAAIAALTRTVSAQELVTNGGFETGSFSGWTLNPGDCGNTGVDAINPHSGTFGAYLGPVDSPCTLSQNISTTIGQHYNFSFWLAQGSGTPNSFAAMFGGQTVFSVVNADFANYTQHLFDVTASSTSTTVQFIFRHDPAYSDFDDVSVMATVPEPSSTVLIAAGLFGLVALGARRRRV